MGFWTFIFIVIAYVGYRYLSWYRSKDLPSPKKELTRLRFSLLLLSATFLFVLFVNLPPFYVATFFNADEINTIQEAKIAIVQLDDALKKLANETQAYNFYVFLLLAVLAVEVIPALYRFSAALVPGESVEEDIDNDKLVSIFEEDKNHGK